MLEEIGIISLIIFIVLLIVIPIIATIILGVAIANYHGLTGIVWGFPNNILFSNKFHTKQG